MIQYLKRKSCVGFLATISLLVLGSPSKGMAQNWDDVAFWSADFALNTMQRQAAAQQLEEYRKTYVVLRDGYEIVRGLVSDNHQLHQEFFVELASINPVVKNYYKVVETSKIYGRELVNLRRDAPRLVGLIRNTDTFTPAELEQVQRIFDGMVDRIVGGAEDLFMVATSGDGDLQMMDSERIVLVDRLYAESLEIVSSIRDFRVLLLNLAAQRSDTNVNNLESLFRVRP
ncbi:hypothetical protein LEM8419_03414 [Neolewinella maritima]|uniref:TerB family tellurite resistance protein n=1 Tax=Neolewinella maritima TaxID=1383882 RepID=A0ABN8F6F3_9BACT|nr:hypothetical protein LEM8419_03414 [Neolewinella maritima]